MDFRQEPWVDRNIGSHFLKEARRLWEIEESNPSLTTVQSAVVLASTMGMEGKDRLGWQFLEKGLQMAKKIGLFETTSPSLNEDSLLYRARAITAWSIFKYSAYVRTVNRRDVRANGHKAPCISSTISASRR